MLSSLVRTTEAGGTWFVLRQREPRGTTDRNHAGQIDLWIVDSYWSDEGEAIKRAEFLRSPQSE
jgi:hypothetical protein